MKLIDKSQCEIVKMTKLGDDIFDIVVNASLIAEHSKAGQFVHIYIPGHVLRRPISICQTDAEAKTIRLVFQIRGAGTEILSKFNAGDFIDILGPLGKGFPLFSDKKNVLIVGGGIGVPPLLNVAAYYGKASEVCLGFRSKGGVILEDDFKKYTDRVFTATEDGTWGKKGYVSNLFSDNAEFDCIYTCGPSAMIHAVCGYAKRLSIPCYISLEERMACGVGACLGCACELLDENGNEFYGHVCKDGPVFDYNIVKAYSHKNEGGVNCG